MQTDADTMLCDADAPHQIADEAEAARLCRSLTCPVLVIGGDQDKIVPAERARRIAELTSAELLVIGGGGHAPHVRYPVAVNHAIRDFVNRLVPRRRKQAVWRATHGRRRRALWISSPIGLGHVQRDLAIARAVRKRVPDLEIHWWAQPPVTDVLAEAGEIIHPASSELASESAHWESEAADHDLPAFYAFRRMDEIFCANYLLFDDVVRDTSYDLWVGDECWEIDYFLHENPERKIAPYVFMTDVIGFLPTDPGDSREAELCADYNADSIEKRERFPQLRDLSMFIGSFDELPDRLVRARPARNTVMVSPVVLLGPLRAPLQSRRLPRPRPVAASARLSPGPAVAGGGGGRHGGRRQPARADLRRVRPAAQAGARQRGCSWSPARASIPGCCPTPRAWTSAATCPICSSIWRAPTRPSCKAACRPRWNWSAPDGRSSTSRCAATGNSSTSSPTGSATTAPGCGWTTRRPQPTTWPRRCGPRWRKPAPGRATGRSREAARPAPPRGSPHYWLASDSMLPSESN